MAEDTAARPGPRLPLNTLGAGLGLAGLAGTWTAADGLLGAPAVVGDALWVVAAVVWALILTRYLTTAGPHGLAEDLRNPVAGPFAALAPAVASLLSARLADEQPALGRLLVWIALAFSAAFGAWFVATLLTVPREAVSLHGAYLLPTVAASLIAAQSVAAIGHREAATALFAVGIVFWVLIGALLLTRFATGPAIPVPLLPTLAVFSAPPAVAGNAWWAIAGPVRDEVQTALLGTLAALLLPHLFLLPRYLRMDFTLGFWAFTFTIAASATYGLRMLSLSTSAWSTALSWTILALATGLIGAIAVRSLAVLPRPHRHLRHGHVQHI
ncbi:C4-dicarboxylate transporter [Streptomyces sp. NPDC046939]|uniref:SLAC1 family transporter n=1 Tax=Streptomyces sp. NPDC046939 TaxID=3155376 RepID=UPI0033C5B6B1